MGLPFGLADAVAGRRAAGRPGRRIRAVGVPRGGAGAEGFGDVGSGEDGADEGGAAEEGSAAVSVCEVAVFSGVDGAFCCWGVKNLG